MSRFFSLLLPWRDAVTEEIEVPDTGCVAPGRSTTRACRDWGSLRCSMEIASSGSGLGLMPVRSASVGIVALEQGEDLSADRLDLRLRVLGYPAREQFTARSSAATT